MDFDSDHDGETQLRSSQQVNVVPDSNDQSSSVSTSQVSPPNESESSPSKESDVEDTINLEMFYDKEFDEKLKRKESLLLAELEKCNSFLSHIAQIKAGRALARQKLALFEENRRKAHLSGRVTITPPNNIESITMHTSELSGEIAGRPSTSTHGAETNPSK